MKQTILLIIVLISAASLQAGLILSDDFESYTAPSGSFATVITGGTGLLPWNVTAGSIDILNNFLTCHSGTHCIDMDGTNAGGAGTITRSFAGIAGTQYTLTFWYSGNQRGGAVDTMTVSLGTQTLSLTNIPSAQPFTQGTLVFTPGASGSVAITFAHAGSDNIGIILDDVAVNAPDSGVPEPATWTLLGAGLAMVGFLKRRPA
jgi:hypothetical protein